MTRRLGLTLAAALVLVLPAGCGDDDAATTDADGQTTSTTGDRPPQDPAGARRPADRPGFELGLAPTEADPPVDWSVTVHNTTDEDVTLEFSSGQRADLRLLGEDGSTLYTWSATRSFIAALGTEEVPAGGSVTFTLAGSEPDLGPGTYTALVTVPAADPLRAELTVELTG